MLPASNRGVGGNLCFPDVCLTPPLAVPVPYPNMALNAMAVPFVPNVFLTFVNALNMGSIIPLTLLDQAGSMSPFMGPGMTTMGNPIVNMGGLPGKNLLCPASANNMIAPIGATVIPSVTNVFFTRAGAPAEGELTREDLASLPRALRALEGAEVESLLDGRVLHFTIPIFSLALPARLHDAIRRLQPEALVLDLRGCPGGDLSAAVELAADFLAPGTVVATLVDGDGDETVMRSRNPRPRALPVALLVDAATASAAEVFAAALQANGRAVIIGAQTFGKGTAQTALAGSSAPTARYATVATVLSPKGDAIEGRGVRPEVSSSDALETALQILIGA